MGRGTARIFNLISLVFLLLTIGVIIFVILRLQGPEIARDQVAALPTPLVLPTLTPSNTPSNTPPPTFTFTPTNTLTPTQTETPTQTVPPSPTITDTPGPTDTPSVTPTPSISPTPEPSATPTGPSPTPPPTVSPFLFDLRDGQVIYTQNFANTAGCAWQGIGGQVFDLQGAPLPSLRIHIFNEIFDRYVDSGTNSLYGQAGWEVPVDNKISPVVFYVELQSQAGTVISPRITVQFPSDCAKNLALVNFIQVRER